MSDDVNEWLDRAKDITSRSVAAADVRAVRQRLDTHGLSSALALSRRDIRMAVACALMSAAATVWASTQFVGRTEAVSQATWLLSPSAVSPFGLLVGR